MGFLWPYDHGMDYVLEKGNVFLRKHFHPCHPTTLSKSKQPNPHLPPRKTHVNTAQIDEIRRIKKCIFGPEFTLDVSSLDFLSGVAQKIRVICEIRGLK